MAATRQTGLAVAAHLQDVLALLECSNQGTQEGQQLMLRHITML